MRPERTYGRTDGPTDTPSDRDATAHLKMGTPWTLFVFNDTASTPFSAPIDLILYKFLESCCKKVAPVISDEMFSNSKRDQNICYEKLSKVKDWQNIGRISRISSTIYRIFLIFHVNVLFFGKFSLNVFFKEFQDKTRPDRRPSDSSPTSSPHAPLPRHPFPCLFHHFLSLPFTLCSGLDSRKFSRIRKNGSQTDRRTDGWRDRRTDRPSYRDARTHLKKLVKFTGSVLQR